MKKRTIFELSPSDIQESWWGSFGQQRGSIITLRHAPTGLEVVGEVPQVHRTHRQLRAAEADLRARLMMELTEAVTKHLRIPGR